MVPRIELGNNRRAVRGATDVLVYVLRFAQPIRAGGIYLYFFASREIDEIQHAVGLLASAQVDSINLKQTEVGIDDRSSAFTSHLDGGD
jgi:hypothetical protein